MAASLGGAVTIDGADYDTPATVLLFPGEHRVVIEEADGTRRTRRVQLEESHASEPYVLD